MDPFTLSHGPVTGFSNETSPCGGNDEVRGEFAHIWDLVSDKNDIVVVAQEGVVDSFSRAWQTRIPYGYPGARAWNIGKANAVPTFTRD